MTASTVPHAYALSHHCGVETHWNRSTSLKRTLDTTGQELHLHIAAEWTEYIPLFTRFFMAPTGALIDFCYHPPAITRFTSLGRRERLHQEIRFILCTTTGYERFQAASWRI